MRRTRSMTAVRDQVWKLSAAARTAASTSRPSDRGTCSITSAVAGLNTRSDLFHIPEDVTLPWSEGVCRFVVEGGPNYTSDAQKQFPKSSVARLLEIRTFISYPVFTAEGRFFGTLCGASKEQVEIQQEILELMRECALLIGQRLKPDSMAGSESA